MIGLDRLLRQLSGFWAALNAAQRVALTSIVLITSGSLALLISVANRPDYATLFSGLEPTDAAKVVDELEGREVPYKLSHAGTVIQVPIESVYDLRLDLATQGLPGGGPVGFEVFEESGLGSTPFQERVRFRRALEGELSRTISQLDPVNWTRVHINLPDRRVFQRDRNKPTASVVVSLRPGETLSGSEVKGIGHLVAGAVDGLSVDQVTLLDTQGRLLARAGSGEEDDMLAADALDLQRSLERRLVSRAQSLLDAALGPQAAVVTVSATIDRRRIEENADRVNPDETAVISEQVSEETRSEPGSLTTGGVAGAAANVPGGAAGNATGGGSAEESVTRSTTNFEVSRSRSRTLIPMGGIERLSIAVLVDGKWDKPVAAEGEELPADAAPVYQPRSAEELTQIGEIVKRAVGFNEPRGDVIEVQNLPFHSPLDDVASAGPLPLWERPELFMLLPGLARTGAILIGIYLLVFLVIRPALKQLTLANIVASTSAAGGVPGESGEEAVRRVVSEAERLREQLSNENPRLVADAMRQLLRE